ncbi:11413_t:CDS:2, partial [Racocetra persica]
NSTLDESFSYDVTPEKYSSIIIGDHGTTPSAYSDFDIDRSGFGYKYSYVSQVSLLNSLLARYSVPFVNASTSNIVDLGGSFVYLFDSNDRSPTGADPLCGSTTSFVKECDLRQRLEINPNWCLLIGNFFVTQSVNY